MTSIVDSHLHLWDTQELSYPWLAAGPEPLARPFLPDDAERALAGHGSTSGAVETAGEVSGVIVVEADARADQALAEAHFLTDLADRWPALTGIVAAADLRSPRLAEHLRALRELPLVVGVRHLLQDAPPGALRDPAMRAGLALVAEHGLVFDACVRHHQLAELAEVIDDVEGLRIVLDHLGKPPVAAGIASPAGRAWRDSLARVAANGDTWVKLSGLAPEAGTPADLEDHGDGFLAAAVGIFGPDRAMVGSDWPVSAHLGAATSPGAWFARVARVVRQVAGESAWQRVAGGSARACYGVG